MKTFFKITFLVIIALTIFSCATTAKYEQRIKTWMGHDVNELITSWGPPSNVYTMPNGNKMYTWLRISETLVTSNYNYFLNMTLTNSVTYWCKTTFTADRADKIINSIWEGNNCISN